LKARAGDDPEPAGETRAVESYLERRRSKKNDGQAPPGGLVFLLSKRDGGT